VVVMVGGRRRGRPLQLVATAVRRVAACTHVSLCDIGHSRLELCPVLLAVVDPVGDAVLGGKIPLVCLWGVVVLSHGGEEERKEKTKKRILGNRRQR